MNRPFLIGVDLIHLSSMGNSSLPRWPERWLYWHVCIMVVVFFKVFGLDEGVERGEEFPVGIGFV